MENYVIIAVIFSIVIFWVFSKMRRVNEFNSWLEAKGVNLDHNYSNVLGVDAKSGRVFVYTDAAYLFNKNEIRSVERSSILETKYNVYGTGFHKDKQCQLVIHTASMDKPLHVIGFDRKDEMDVWYSRLGAFCSLK